MFSDIYFHVEVLTDQGWAEPPQFSLRELPTWPGEFTWMPRSARADDLFFGPDALFPFKTSLAVNSPLLAKVQRTHPLGDSSWIEDRRPAWIPFGDLMVDTWNDETTVLVTSRLPRTVAPLFGDGLGALPADALAKIGWTAPEVDALSAAARTR